VEDKEDHTVLEGGTNQSKIDVQIKE